MAESITYGSYSFPEPMPLVGQSTDTIYVEGKLDHYLDNVSIVGNFTGSNLAGLHLQKMQLISGLLSEFQTLTISNDTEDKTFTSTKPVSVSFSDSDLTTILPYAVTFESYSSATFSEYFGVENPVDTWQYQEEDGKITNVTHNVSAVGVKVNSTSPLDNARHFVTGRTTGCRNISLFQTGTSNGDLVKNAVLISRTEEVNKGANSYGITENYKYTTSDNPVITESGIFNSTTQISFDKQAGLSVNVNASVQGSIDSIRQPNSGMIETGMFTSEQATDIAVNAVANSLSDYESGAYTFINRGPKTFNYNIDTGTNKIDFNYVFQDPSNVDQVDNVLHKKNSSISASKDNSKVTVNVNGEFIYNSPFDVFTTGDPSTGQRFLQVDARFSGFASESGFLNQAVDSMSDFRQVVTGYHISGDFINPEPLSKSITKTPADGKISYSLQFDNRIDLASGTLSGLKMSISDKKPIEVSGILPSIAGFAKQKIKNRSAGEYRISATCEGDTGKLQQLVDVVSGNSTGFFVFSENSAIDEQTISYNMSRYY